VHVPTYPSRWESFDQNVQKAPKIATEKGFQAKYLLLFLYRGLHFLLI
jgi:hypothetical protein